jgi:hypothetical protein
MRIPARDKVTVSKPVHIRLDEKTRDRLRDESARRNRESKGRELWYFNRTMNAVLDEAEAYRKHLRSLKRS